MASCPERQLLLTGFEQLPHAPQQTRITTSLPEHLTRTESYSVVVSTTSAAGPFFKIDSIAFFAPALLA